MPHLSSSTGGRGAAFPYALQLADNAMILAQRNSEWCGHGPVLEQDIAITNISLDLLGQARNFYQQAVALHQGSSDEDKETVANWLPPLWKGFNRPLEEDDLAFLREPSQYLNATIVEIPNVDWAQTILRQFFFSAFQYYQYTALQSSPDKAIAIIAEKSLKETTYHLRWSSEWVIRLSRGTAESRQRMEWAMAELWPYVAELFVPAAYEQQVTFNKTGVDCVSLEPLWLEKVTGIFTKAGLPVPAQTSPATDSKNGNHTHYLQALLEDMQYMQRTYPNASW